MGIETNHRFIEIFIKYNYAHKSEFVFVYNNMVLENILKNGKCR